MKQSETKKKLSRFRVTAFRLFTEVQQSFYSIEEHHRPNIQILRTTFSLVFYYYLFQTQTKSRTREHAVMLSFALAFWKKEVPEEVSRTEKLSIESPARAVSHCA